MGDLEVVQPRDGSLLSSIRSVLEDAEDALLCVAFAREEGVRLLGKELEAAGRAQRRVRLLATTVFGGSESALDLAAGLGAEVRVLNPRSRSTYHPKAYLGRSHRRRSGVIGSANLTSGLVNNIELGVHLVGGAHAQVLTRAWEVCEALWNDEDARKWVPDQKRAPTEIEPELRRLLQQLVRRDPVVLTVSDGRRNRVTEITPGELYVETGRTQARGTGAQPIPAWMLNLAWETLRTQGEISNARLLNELRVHRSSAVCALMARLPGVHVKSVRPIVLGWAR